MQINHGEEAHAHVLSKRHGVEWLPGITLPDFTPLDVARIAQEMGIRIGLTQTRFSMAESHAYLGMAMANEHIGRAFPWLDLRQPASRLRDDIATLMAYYGPHFAGMRHLVQFEGPHWLSLNDTQAGMDVWAETGKPFKICVYNNQIPQVMDFITGKGGMKDRKEQAFWIDHNFKERADGSKVSQHWFDAIDALKDYPKVCVQFSGFFGEDAAPADWFNPEKLVSMFIYLIKKLGHSRIIFGSDLPMFLGTGKVYQNVLDVMVHCAEAARLSQAQFDDIMGGNLRRLCGELSAPGFPPK